MLENHDSALAGFLARRKDHNEAELALAETAEGLTQSAEALEPARAKLAEMEQAVAKLKADARLAEARLAQHQRSARLAQAAEQRRSLQQSLDQARDLMQQIAGLKAQAEQGPDRAALQRIETAREALSLASQAQKLKAFSLTVRYEPGREGQLTLDGIPLSEGERIALPKGGSLEAPGLGRIDLHPGEKAGGDQLDQARQELDQALLAADCPDVEQARLRHQSRQEACIRLEEAQVQLKQLAPEGVMALMQRLDALPTEGAEAEGPPLDENPENLEKTVLALRSKMDVASVALEQARAEEARQRLALEGARVNHQAALQRLERADAALVGQGDNTEKLASLELRQVELRQVLAEQREQYQALQQAAPDLAMAQARAARARSEQTATREAQHSHQRDLAVLDSRIATIAGMAVEEELAEVSDQVIAAQKRLASVEFEVSVLRRLDLALEQARNAAQEAYVGPVLQELQPLLRLLWPEARLGLDAGRVLPDQLTRAGQEEAFDSLSGGTQEQIALLVRLAFARLLARGGQPAPIILDDAIVYTDDARIEKIFDALTLQADEMQILVFTCRQKSFRALGGTQLSIRPATALA